MVVPNARLETREAGSPSSLRIRTAELLLSDSNRRNRQSPNERSAVSASAKMKLDAVKNITATMAMIWNNDMKGYCRSPLFH